MVGIGGPQEVELDIVLLVLKDLLLKGQACTKVRNTNLKKVTMQFSSTICSACYTIRCNELDSSSYGSCTILPEVFCRGS